MTRGIGGFVRSIAVPEPPTLRKGASVVVRMMLVGAALSVVVFTSVALYGIFYRLYVPQLLHESPVYFHYPAPSGAGSSNTTAVVTFVPESDYKFLSTSQAYRVSLELEVPTSDTNQQVGSFMVYLELQTRRGVVVGQSARPAIMQYRSRMVRIMQTAVWAVPLALGLSREAEHLHVELVDVLYDRHFSPITSAHIALSKPLQVYGARLVICAQFSGLRYWMYYWRLPTAIVFIAAAVVWQALLTAGAWSVFESYTARSAGRIESKDAVLSASRSLTGEDTGDHVSDTAHRSRYASASTLTSRKRDRVKRKRRLQLTRGSVSGERDRSVPSVASIEALGEDSHENEHSDADADADADSDSRNVPDS
ncbi:hypothetical protein H4217_004465 [Coemansia sp. RSA 1939]|nr:hypothetical protein H4217_004465 [Coemansia sp. RSA 1939]KAJ2609758.1 hypothetical protein EV177_004305 [Coemansia sp. RSA 1804]